MTELKADLNAYLASTDPAQVPTRTLADLIAFNEAEPRETELFGQELFLRAEATNGLDDPAYIAARETSFRLAGPEGIDRMMATNTRRRPDRADDLAGLDQRPADDDRRAGLGQPRWRRWRAIRT